MHAELHFRSDYAPTAQGRSQLARLIDDVFDVDVSPLDRLGHDPSIVSFGWWHGDDLVANVSLYERRLRLLGDEVPAFGVQSVATRPQWRGKGLFRDLMNRALDHADARVGLVALVTDTPALYTQFGFREVVETASCGALPQLAPSRNCRLLSLDEEADVTLLRDLFARRLPSSDLAAACDHPALFMLKAVASPEIDLFHLPDLDAVVAVRRPDRDKLILLDLVAPATPSLQAIAAAIGYDQGEVQVHLTPDRLSWTPERTMALDTGYMVRGPFPPEGLAFMLGDMRI